MENNLEIFTNPEFGNSRIIEKNGEPWFIGKDVAEALGYEASRNAITKHVDDEDKLTHQISASGQNRNMTVINESGLYSLILSSKLPTAKKFKRWVTSEVLPAIRKHGNYASSKQESKSKSIDLEIRLNNSKARMASEYRRIAEMTDIKEYKHICQQKAVEVLAGMPLLPMEEVTERTYSATDIGKMFGVSKNKIGSLANANNLKTAEYGKLFYDKSPHSQKQVETFRYYECAVEKFKELLKGGEQE